MERCRRGSADPHQISDLIVAQRGGGVVVFGSATAQNGFDDGIRRRRSVGCVADVVHWVAPSSSDYGAQFTDQNENNETELSQYDARKDQSCVSLLTRARLAAMRLSAPFAGRHPHSLGKDTPECRNGLIADRFGHGLGADRRLFQLVGCKAHTQISQ